MCVRQRRGPRAELLLRIGYYSDTFPRADVPPRIAQALTIGSSIPGIKPWVLLRRRTAAQNGRPGRSETDEPRAQALWPGDGRMKSPEEAMQMGRPPVPFRGHSPNPSPGRRGLFPIIY